MRALRRAGDALLRSVLVFGPPAAALLLGAPTWATAAAGVYAMLAGALLAGTARALRSNEQAPSLATAGIAAGLSVAVVAVHVAMLAAALVPLATLALCVFEVGLVWWQSILAATFSAIVPGAIAVKLYSQLTKGLFS
jgi:hypothetical protein